MRKLIYGISLIPLFLFASISTFAQDDEDEGPNFIVVRSVETYLDGANTWMEQQEKMAEVRQENGLPTRHVWREMFGEMDTFHVVSFHQSLGGFGGPAPESPMSDRAMDRWISAITPTVQSRKTLVWRAFPEFYIPGNYDYEYMVLQFLTVAPGQHGAFQTWLEEKYIPALKSLDHQGTGVSRLAHGGDAATWLITERIESPGTLDGPPPIFSLDQEARAEIFEGINDIVVRRERRVVRYLANLSNNQEEE